MSLHDELVAAVKRGQESRACSHYHVGVWNEGECSRERIVREVLDALGKSETAREVVEAAMTSSRPDDHPLAALAAEGRGSA